MKKYLLAFLFSFLIYAIIGIPLRGIREVGFVGASMIETSCYAVAVYFMLKRYAATNREVWLLTGVIILARIFLEIPIRLIDFKGTLMSLPNMLLACVTIILAALVFSTKNKYVCLFSLVAWGYCTFIGHEKLLEYMKWGAPLKVQVASLTINTSEGAMPLKSIKSEYLLLDFWNSACGVCYEKFPEFQSLHDKNSGKVKIASVFVPFRKNEQASDGEDIISKRGYTFPVWSVAPKDTLLKVLKVERFPTIILLDKERNVIFRGNLENAKKKLEDIIN